jgi:two-component system, OmpR family, response regulator
MACGAAMAAPPERAPRILVVDDDARFASTVRDLLRDEGYDVAMALNGSATIERLLDFAPDVLVLDLLMPGGKISGYDVLNWVEQRASKIPVVVLTGDDDWQPRDGMVKLRKPCTLDGLLDSVAAALRASPSS